MKKKYKDRWVKALRSGKYKQGVGALVMDGIDGPQYCCLGVLCDIVQKEANLTRGKIKEGFRYGKNGIENAFLPRHVRNLVGLDYTNPEVKVSKKYFALSTLNDGSDAVKKRSFKQIADIIEKQL